MLLFHSVKVFTHLQLWCSWSHFYQSGETKGLACSSALPTTLRLPKLLFLFFAFYSHRQTELEEVDQRTLQPSRTWRLLMTSSAKYPVSSRGAAESQLLCCLARHSPSPRCSTQQPPSSPTERKYQRVLLKQCGFNLRGAQAFKLRLSVSQGRFFKLSLNASHKKTLWLLGFSQQNIVQKPLHRLSFLCFLPLFFCFWSSFCPLFHLPFDSHHAIVANGLLCGKALKCGNTETPLTLMSRYSHSMRSPNQTWLSSLWSFTTVREERLMWGSEWCVCSWEGNQSGQMIKKHDWRHADVFSCQLWIRFFV